MANFRGLRRQRNINLIDLPEENPAKQIVNNKRKRKADTDCVFINLTGDEAPMDVTLSLERLSYFRKKVCQAFINSRQQVISVIRLKELVNANNDETFSDGEIDAALIQMADANQVMVSDGFVYLI